MEESHGQYFALCVKGEDGEDEIAFLDLGKDEELGQLIGMAVYTTPDGEVQRQDLNKYRGIVTIAPVSPSELLDAVQWAMPTSVLLDGEKLAESVFTRMLKDELGIPIRRLRLLPRYQDARTQDPPG